MRPVRLEFCGINSFSEPAVIDFDSLLSFGIFGIFGDTGSGKSTILDCIGFALYGNVSRSRSGSIAEIVNYRSDKAYADFEFEITYEGRRRKFRVERELKRKNAVQSAKVFELDENGAHALAEGVRDCNALLEKIVGLGQKDFEKCIALPQGEFAQFVKSQRSDRLKLVSRLFDLEEYGEELVKRANARNAELQEGKKLAAARLEPYAGVSAEHNRALKEEVEELEARESAQRTALDMARLRKQTAEDLAQKRRELAKISERYAALDAQREHFRALKGELGRLGGAAAVCRAAQEAKSLGSESALAVTALKECARAKQQAEEAFAALPDNAEEEEREIARLTERKIRAEQFEANRQKRAALQTKLARVRADYVVEAEKFAGFSYEREREAIEEQLLALGRDSDFAFEEGKAELLRGEYQTFASELSPIREEYPETERLVTPLIEKYTLLSEGERGAVSLKRRLEEREAARRQLQLKQVELEKKNGLYVNHRDRLQQLQTEGVRLGEELKELDASAKEEEVPFSVAQQELSAKLAEKKKRGEERERLRRDAERLSAAFAAAVERARSLRSALERAETNLSEALKLGNFSSSAEAAALLDKFGNAERAGEEVEAFERELALVSARREELTKLDLAGGTEEELSKAEKEADMLRSEHEACMRDLALKKDALVRGEEALEKKRGLEREHAAVIKQADVAERLKKLLEGNKFMEFVAEEYLQNIAENGSRRLLSLTSGRYFLRYDGGFLVGDNFNGGETRAVYTLSGGETFLVSLSLALSLSEEICFKSLRPIEFFFLDEGFGTLDGRLVDTVMDSLEKLKSENFSIGIISHVEELKHRIERKLIVEKATETHGSRIRV